jgi:uncharacterized protein YodC (DUF2158 family)
VKFEVGDTVLLKSGSEVMTVEGVSEDSIDCVWFNGKKVERSSFDPATLKKYDDSFSGF